MSVEELLADPKFDVEQFIHNVRLHATKPVLTTLFNDPYMLLSIAESDDYEILQIYSPRKADVYEKMEKMGFEAWEKTSQRSNSWWYGIVVTDELAILAKNVQYNRVCDVFKGKDAAVKARKRFKQLKLHKKGEGNESLAPGKRPIDLIRKTIMDKIDPFVSGSGYYSYNRNSCEKSRFSYDLTRSASYHSEERMVFKVISAGHSIKVGVEKWKPNPNLSKQQKNSARYNYGRVRTHISDWVTEKINLKLDDGSFKSADKVADEVIDFLKKNNKYLSPALNKVKTV